MSVFLSGKNSSVYVFTTGTNFVELASMSWQVSEQQSFADFTNSLTGTFTQCEPTFKSCTFTCSTDHNWAARPWDTNGANLSILNQGTAGLHIALVYDRTQGTAGGAWDFPTAYLVNTTMSDATEGKPTENFNFRASGPWNEPTV